MGTAEKPGRHLSAAVIPIPWLMPAIFFPNWRPPPMSNSPSEGKNRQENHHQCGPIECCFGIPLHHGRNEKSYGQSNRDQPYQHSPQKYTKTYLTTDISRLGCAIRLA